MTKSVLTLLACLVLASFANARERVVIVKSKPAVRVAPIRSVAATVNENRPHLFARLVAYFTAPPCGVTVRMAGPATFARMPVGSGATVVKVTTVTTKAVAAPPLVGGPFRDRKPIRNFLIRHGVPESKLAAHEARVGAGNVDWVGLLLAFVKGGIQAVLELLGG